jgi:predicted extracellular nuclease
MKGYYFLILITILLSISCSGEETDPEIEKPLPDNFSKALFFSEYVEGTSFNKALEIVNLTGKDVVLEAEKYSIKKQTNGSGDWMGEVQLSGNLAHKDVFVISNESADIPELIEQANQLKTGAPMDFNGNDPIGLFKDGQLIDIIGQLDKPEDFAKDKTLRRKKNSTEPSISYETDNWEVLEMNSIDGVGDY